MNSFPNAIRSSVLLFVLCLCLGGPVMAAPADTDADSVDAAVKKLMAANGLYQRQMYKLACAEYEEFLAKYPTHEKAADARYAYAVCRYRLREYDKAVPLLEKVLQDNKFDKRDEAMAVLGHAYLASSQNEKALKVLDQLLKQFPKSQHTEIASINRAQVLYVLDRHAEALQACSKFLLDHPDSSRAAEAQYLMALSQKAQNQPADAVATLNALLGEHAAFPQRTDAELLLGQCHEQTGNYEQAVQHYRQIAEQGPENRRADGLYSMGVAYNRWQKRNEARQAFEKVIQDYPDSRYAAPARLQLGLAQLGAKQIDQARITLQQVIEKDPARANMARYYLAQCDITEKKYAEARKQLDQLIKLQPPPDNLNDILFDRAGCVFAMNDYRESVELFGQFLNRFPKDPRAPQANYRRAFCLHKLNQYERSLSLCEQILRETDKVSGVVELRAENLFLLKRYDDAAKAIVEAMKVEQDIKRQWRLSLRLGQCAYFKKDYARAIEVLSPMLKDKQLGDDVNLQRGVFLLGDAQLQLNQNTQAAQTLSKYLSVANQNIEEAQYKLALAQLRSEQPDQAMRILQELVNGKPDEPWVIRGRYELGQLLYNRDQRDKAEPLLKQVVEQKVVPSLQPQAMYLLAWIQTDAKKFEQAADQFKLVAERYPDHALASEAAYYRAACLRQAGNNDQALKLLEQFVAKYTDSKRLPQAKYLMAVCHSRMKQHEKAIAILKPLAEDKQTVDDKVLYELAWAQRAAKQDDQAMKTYQRLIQTYPESRLAMTGRAELAELLYGKEKYTEAAGLLEKVLADGNLDSDLLNRCRFRMGWCYVRLNQVTEAVDHFTKFIEQSKDPNLQVSARYQIGLAYAESDRHDQAAEQFNQIISKHGKHELAPLAMLKLGEVQAAAGQYDQSEKTYQKFLGQFKDNAYRFLAEFGIGWALENRKQYDQARQWYAKVIEGHNGPTAARAQFQTGETYFAQGAYDRATRELLKVDIVYGYPQWSAKALYEAGRAFQQLNAPDKAKAQFEQCLKKYKDEPVAALAKKALEQLNR